MQDYRDDKIPHFCPIFSGIEITPITIAGRERLSMSTVGLAVH